MRITIILFILFNLITGLIARGPIDSLQNAYNTTEDQKEKAVLGAEISGYYLEIDVDSSLLYAIEGLELSEILDYDFGIAKNAAMLGDNYIRLDSLEKAKHYYTKAAVAFEKTDHQRIYSKVLLVLGNIHIVTNNFPEALNAYQKSMKVCEENGYDETLAHLHNNIGAIYLEMDNLEKALESSQAAYDGFQKIEAELNTAQALLSIGIVLKRLEEFDQAIITLDRALEIFQNLNDLENIAEANRIIGLIFRDKKEYETALSYFNRALSIVNLVDFQSLAPKSVILSTLYLNLSQANFYLKEYEKANRYSLKSLDISTANRYVKKISENYLLLSEISDRTSQIDDAYKYLKLHKIYSDSVMNENAIEKITQLQLEYDFAKKISERELAQSIKDARQQRLEYIYIIAIVLVIFVAIVGFLLFINQKNKTRQSRLKRMNLELERENLTQKLDLNQKELEYKNKELTTNIMYLTKKTGMITNIAKELQNAKFDFEGENRDTIENVIRQLEDTSSDDTWKEFEVRFQDVHTEFYDNLNEALPDLTPNEKKLCAFLKLNMSTKDISAITHQSVKSLTMARYRLRQKLNLDRDENLISFLAKL